MSNAKHTPGPWEVVEIEEGLFHIHSPKGDRVHPVPVSVVDYHRDGHEEIRTIKSRANARLIAAAPDLLRLLQAMLDLHIAHHNEPIHAAARKAIAAATERRLSPSECEETASARPQTHYEKVMGVLDRLEAKAAE